METSYKRGSASAGDTVCGAAGPEEAGAMAEGQAVELEGNPSVKRTWIAELVHLTSNKVKHSVAVASVFGP